MKKRRKFLMAGCVLFASLFIMTACARVEEPADEPAQEAYDNSYTPSAEEISSALAQVNEESTQSEVLSGDIFEFYIDNDVNIIKLQMPANYMEEDAVQTGSSFEAEVTTTGEYSGHYEIKAVVYSLEQVRGSLELLESRYPDSNGGGIPRVDPHWQNGSCVSVYETRTSDGLQRTDKKMHGEKAVEFGSENGETEAVLLVEAITNYREFGEYNGIYKVLDSIIPVDVNDSSARGLIDGLNEKHEEYMEEKMKDAVTITNPEICRDLCESLGLEETDRFALEDLSIRTRDFNFSALRDEDIEWLPYITLTYMDTADLDFRNNKNITNLKILGGFECFKNWDEFEWYEEGDEWTARLKIGDWRGDSENLISSLDGIEDLFNEDSPYLYLELLDIGRCPNLENIDALKKIGNCGQIHICLDDCPKITAEMLQDVYDNNPNINIITVMKRESLMTCTKDYEITR